MKNKNHPWKFDLFHNGTGSRGEQKFKLSMSDMHAFRTNADVIRFGLDRNSANKANSEAGNIMRDEFESPIRAHCRAEWTEQWKQREGLEYLSRSCAYPEGGGKRLPDTFAILYIKDGGIYVQAWYENLHFPCVKLQPTGAPAPVASMKGVRPGASWRTPAAKTAAPAPKPEADDIRKELVQSISDTPEEGYKVRPPESTTIEMDLGDGIDIAEIQKLYEQVAAGVAA